ncbi:MAG: hypothetical protein N3B21_05760 [Clostridia bacterium]|nr:hypothetical protein [Clostridia bacterium]
MDSNKIKHLELITGAINRMANNSFLLKGWSVTLVSALFALAAKDANFAFIYLCYFPAIAFWALDGYFLWKENIFCDMFENVRLLDEKDIDFCMKPSNTGGLKAWLSAIFSPTLGIFYGVILLSISTIVVIMTIKLRM